MAWLESVSLFTLAGDSSSLVNWHRPVGRLGGAGMTRLDKQTSYELGKRFVGLKTFG